MGGVAWTEEEDQLLKKCIELYGEGKWHRVPLLAGLNRCRKSCRLRWLNYLRPNIKRGSFAEDEVQLIIKLHKLLGNKWSLIAGRLPGRTANDVKNYWNCHLSKKLSVQDTDEEFKSSMNVESIAPQQPAQAQSIEVTGSTKARSQDYHVAPNSLPTIQESNSSTPFNFIGVDQQGHELLKEEMEIGVDDLTGGVFVDELATEVHQFDEVNVLGRSDEGCSKWDWDDLMLDMDLWTDSL